MVDTTDEICGSVSLPMATCKLKESRDRPESPSHGKQARQRLFHKNLLTHEGMRSEAENFRVYHWRIDRAWLKFRDDSTREFRRAYVYP